MHQQEAIFFGNNNNSNNNNNNNNNETTVNNKKSNLFAEFVCQALPSAHHTCGYLQEEANNEYEQLVIRSRKQPTSNTTMTSASSMDVRQVFRKWQSLPELMKNNSNSILTKKYSMRKIEKNINAWFNKNNKTRKNSKNRKNRGKNNENTNTNNLLDPNGPFKKCLSKESEHRLKLASWNLFRHILSLVRMHSSSRQQQSLSSLFRSSSSLSSMKTNHNLILSSEFQKQQPQNEIENANSDDEGHSWMIPVKAAHDASFDEHVSSGSFCELDLDMLFDDKEFVQFVFF